MGREKRDNGERYRVLILTYRKSSGIHSAEMLHVESHPSIRGRGGDVGHNLCETMSQIVVDSGNSCSNKVVWTNNANLYYVAPFAIK